MLRRALVALAALGAIVAYLVSQRAVQEVEPLVGGRKNKVLFITDSHHGLCNVHLATTSALLEYHPSIEVHYASFPALSPDVARLAENARAKNPDAQAVHFHPLGGPSVMEELAKKLGNISGFMLPPGPATVRQMVDTTVFLLAPWSKEDHWNLYRESIDLIEAVDPAVVVLELTMRPSVDAARNLNRVRAAITPNALADIYGLIQPQFWKYPAFASGIAYPVRWHQIPVNFYQQLRFAIGIFFSADLKAKKAYLQKKGVKHAVHLYELFLPEVPLIAMNFPEAGLPLGVVPGQVKSVGPIVLDEAPAEAQDANLAAWLKQAPTMLINMGTLMRFDEQRARVVVDSIIPVLEATDIQILWKIAKLVDFGDDYLTPAKAYIESGRLRVERWLAADVMSLYNTGDIIVSVHHGGANLYHETVLAGIPQVILPFWTDLYSFATVVEYLGIGVWPGKDTAPRWEPAALSEGFMKALDGETSIAMRQKAKALGEKALAYGGRQAAAQMIADMAAQGN